MPVFQGSTPGAPVDVVTQPLVPVGGVAKITGTTYTDGKRLTVAIVITNPKSKKFELNSKCDDKGNFKVEFKDTQETGEYTLVATSPDGKQTTTVKFTVASPTNLADKASQTVDQIIQAVDTTMDETKKIVDEQPPSPAKEELYQKMDKFNEKRTEFKQRLSHIRPAMTNLAKMVGRTPELDAEILPKLEEYGRWAGETGPSIEAQMANLSKARTKSGLCDTIEMAGEGFAFLSTAMNFVGSPAKILLNLTVDKVMPALVAKAPAKGDSANDVKFLWAETNKEAVAICQGWPDFVGSFLGLANDLAQFATGKIFDQYCQKFQGDMAATFNVDMKEGGSSWWKYGVRLDGQLTLTYPKNGKPGEPIKMNGRFEGNATKFAFWEDVFLVEDRPKGSIIVGRYRIPPVPFVNSTKDPLGFGMVARAGTPGYFNVLCEAELIKDKIILQTQQAAVDFSPVVKNRLILIFTTPALPIPVIKTFDFPIQKAQFIIGRGIKDKAEIPIKMEDKKMTFDKVFTRNETLKDGSTVKWEVKLTGSNPP